jgi:hypothetical protein
MGFTAGSNINVGATVTHTQWNAYYGASGSVDYLKGEADKVDLATISADLTGTRALGTAYQNTTGKTLLVSVSAHATAATSPLLTAYVELGDATPDVTVASIELDNNAADTSDGHVTFIVPPLAYYQLTSTNLSLRHWFEWELF